MSLLKYIVYRKTKEKCKGSKQKCEKPVNTFHNLSVVLAVVIPTVCVFLLVLSIIFYLWRRHKKEEKLEAEFDNNVEEDINEVYLKEKKEEIKPAPVNENLDYKNKGRLAIMRKRMKDLENNNASVDDLSFFNPPKMKRLNSLTSFSSTNSKKSILASNDGLNIPMIPSSPSKASLSTPTKEDNILLNSNRLEDVSEHDMRDYMKHYDKMMGMSNMENMTGSFPGGRVPSQILQRNKFFAKNPYNRGNNTGTLVKRLITPKDPIREEKLTKENSIDENPFLSENEKQLSKESLVKKETSQSLNGTESETKAAIEDENLVTEQSLSDTENFHDVNTSITETVDDNIIVDKLFNNDINKRIYSNIHANDSGLLHEVEQYDHEKVSEALKDINETEDKDDIVLSLKQEENIQRMKSIYQIYMEKNEEDDMNETTEKDDELGELNYTNPNLSKQQKSFKHTSSIYSESFANKGYEVPVQDHAIPSYDISQYQEQSTDVNIQEIPNPELYTDYYELDPQSEQYYYYDAPTRIHYYFEPLSQQYYYYDERQEQYYCNINSEVYFYDSINHIPYYYDYDEEAYIYLGQPDMDNTQFQQNTLPPNNFRNLQLEQHIVETEEDHPEIEENIEYLRNPSSMNNLTSSSMTNFMTPNKRKITPQRQVKQQLSQNFAFDNYENIHIKNSHGSKAAYNIARESVVMNDPLQFSGTKTKFKPAGSIRNLNSYIQRHSYT
ncbi:hypothetical protein ACO0R3_001675 [Hanseniaspora guilliermondii]